MMVVFEDDQYVHGSFHQAGCCGQMVLGKCRTDGIVGFDGNQIFYFFNDFADNLFCDSLDGILSEFLKDNRRRHGRVASGWNAGC